MNNTHETNEEGKPVEAPVKPKRASRRRKPAKLVDAVTNEPVTPVPVPIMLPPRLVVSSPDDCGITEAPAWPQLRRSSSTTDLEALNPLSATDLQALNQLSADLVAIGGFPSSAIPPRPEEDPQAGDKTSAVVEWMFKYFPKEAALKYAGRKTQHTTDQ